MRIVTIAEHSVDMDLLPKKSKIADLGCRGFIFTNEMRRLGHEVYPIDCDELEGEYIPLAISNFNGHVGLEKFRDPNATRILKGGNKVACMTLEMFSKVTGVEFWDLIKIDIEGSEYEVIMSLDKAPARQISIEYHLHTGVYGESEMLLMENKLIYLGYFPVQHDKTKQHGLPYNYWDSLWILQGAIA